VLSPCGRGGAEYRDSILESGPQGVGDRVKVNKFEQMPVLPFFQVPIIMPLKPALKESNYGANFRRRYSR
jgi:hypothetical protein